MSGSFTEILQASKILNSVNQQVDGGRGYQMFYDTWPKLPKSKRRQMAYTAVLQSSAKLANALSTCSQANIEFIATIKQQEQMIKEYEMKHKTCEQKHTEKDVLIASLQEENSRLGGTASISIPILPIKVEDGLSTKAPSAVPSMHNHLPFEFEELKRKYERCQDELEQEKCYTQKLRKQVKELQTEYSTLQNDRLDSNREQLKVIDYLQTSLQKANKEVVYLKSEIDALHAEKHDMLSYMSHQQDIAKFDVTKWNKLENTCAETIKNVAGIPTIVNTVKDDIKNIKMEIERQKSNASTNLDVPRFKPNAKLGDSPKNCNCNNCTIGDYAKCTFSMCSIISDTNLLSLPEDCSVTSMKQNNQCPTDSLSLSGSHTTLNTFQTGDGVSLLSNFQSIDWCTTPVSNKYPFTLDKLAVKGKTASSSYYNDILRPLPDITFDQSIRSGQLQPASQIASNLPKGERSNTLANFKTFSSPGINLSDNYRLLGENVSFLLHNEDRCKYGRQSKALRYMSL